MTNTKYLICPSAAECPIATNYLLDNHNKRNEHTKIYALITAVDGRACCLALEDRVSKTGEKDLFCMHTQLYNMLYGLIPSRY